MSYQTLPAAFWRGGTSNGLLFHRKDLPEDESAWQPILAAAIGSPDPYGRQLNGMGGGVSSLSKVCVVAPSNRDDADVDYTFIQVGIKQGDLDKAGNCGNMSSTIGPFAVNERIVRPTITAEDDASSTTVRIFNTNTSKVIHSTFQIDKTDVEGQSVFFRPAGNYSIDGVSGTGSCITLSFMSPGGSKTGRLLPTGNTVDRIKLSEDSTIEASLVDAANPGVFIRATDAGVDSPLAPAALDAAAECMEILETIRAKGAEMMGLDPEVQSVPKIVLLFPPNRDNDAGKVDIVCQALSMGQAHKAVPLTLALNLGIACKLTGTLPHSLAVQRNVESTVIGHPSGKIEVGARMKGQDVESAVLYRTARMLMKGQVNCE